MPDNETPSIPSFEDVERELGPDAMGFMHEMMQPEYKPEYQPREEE